MPLFLSTYFLGLCLHVQKRNRNSHAFFGSCLTLHLYCRIRWNCKGLNVNVGGAVLKEEKMFLCCRTSLCLVSKPCVQDPALLKYNIQYSSTTSMDCSLWRGFLLMRKRKYSYSARCSLQLPKTNLPSAITAIVWCICCFPFLYLGYW